jgi:hypothetical protein
MSGQEVARSPDTFCPSHTVRIAHACMCNSCSSVRAAASHPSPLLGLPFPGLIVKNRS